MGADPEWVLSGKRDELTSERRALTYKGFNSLAPIWIEMRHGNGM